MTIQDQLALASAYVQFAQEKGLQRVCWPAESPIGVWNLGMGIVNQSGHMGYPIHGSYDRGRRKTHGAKKRFEGYPPIPGKTLYVSEGALL